MISAYCVLASRGRLNASAPLFDDEAVDVVFSLRGAPAMLGVQIKSRFSSSRRVKQLGGFRVDIKKSTFQARPDRALLAVLYDEPSDDLSHVWLIPSLEFKRLTRQQTRATHWTLQLSLAHADNPWARFLYTKRQLPARLQELLRDMNR
jgi:hypothetical protein